MKVLHNKEKDRTKWGNYNGIALVAHEGKVLLEIVARCLSDNCEGGACPPRSAVGLSSPADDYCRHDFRRWQVAGASKNGENPAPHVLHRPTRRKRTAPSIMPLYGLCYIACHGVPHEMLLAICKLHDGSEWSKGPARGVFSCPCCPPLYLRRCLL